MGHILSRNPPMISLLIDTFYSLLPREWRGQRHFTNEIVTGAVISGALAIIFFTGVAILGYKPFVDSMMTEQMHQVGLKAMEKGGQTAVGGMGILMLLSYLVTPKVLLCIYFIVEGVARMTAAIASREALATLPLWLIAKAIRGGKHYKEVQALPPLVADEVKYVGDELHIASCRKKDWSPLNTIAYEEKFYELAVTRAGDAARPNIYILRPKPEGQIARGMYHYSPAEVLEEK